MDILKFVISSLLFREVWAIDPPCCTEYKGMKLVPSHEGADYITDSASEGLTKESCMDSCVADGRCLASSYYEGGGDKICSRFSQTPRQEEAEDVGHTAFLCRTRALQICPTFPGARTWQVEDNLVVKADSVVDIQKCNDKCLSLHPSNHVASSWYWVGNQCFCFLDFFPPMEHNAEGEHRWDSKVCIRPPIVSCKALDAKRNNSKDCSKHNGLRLYLNGPHNNFVNNLGTMTLDECLEECLTRTECQAANHHNGNCDLLGHDAFNYTVGQKWEKGYVGILCS